MFDFKFLKPDENISSEAQFTKAVLQGLSFEQKRLPSWLIFDSRGSEIFQKITELPEYLPAVCEFEIIKSFKTKIADLVSDKPFQLIELGSGDGGKTQILIEAMLNEQTSFHYYPIDISEGAVQGLIKNLQSKFTGTDLQATGLIGDYFDGLETLITRGNERNLVLFLGVTLNNMEREDAIQFLRRLHQTLNDQDYLVIGFDLMKHPKLLHRAYNDSRGLFEEFNLYLLDRINQSLGGNFKKEFFVQQGHYNPRSHAVESHILSTREQTVYLEKPDRTFHFDAWEGMQTEQSYKYTIEEIESLAAESGFEIDEHLYDSKQYFVDSIWQVRK